MHKTLLTFALASLSVQALADTNASLAPPITITAKPTISIHDADTNATLTLPPLHPSFGQAQDITVVPLDTLAYWDFNSSVADATPSTGTTTPATGTGIASLVGAVTSTFASGDANGGSSDIATGDDSGWNITAFAGQGTGNKSRGVQFAVSTVGFKDIVIGYDLRHSNTSSRYEQVQYSLDGVNFIDIDLFDGNAGDTWFNIDNRFIFLSGIAGVDNNANFTFRVVAAFDPNGSGYLASNSGSNYGTSGTWRFDTVIVAASPAPEPETYALFLAGLGLVGFMARRR